MLQNLFLQTIQNIGRSVLVGTYVGYFYAGESGASGASGASATDRQLLGVIAIIYFLAPW